MVTERPPPLRRNPLRMQTHIRPEARKGGGIQEVTYVAEAIECLTLTLRRSFSYDEYYFGDPKCNGRNVVRSPS